MSLVSILSESLWFCLAFSATVCSPKPSWFDILSSCAVRGFVVVLLNMRNLGLCSGIRSCKSQLVTINCWLCLRKAFNHMLHKRLSAAWARKSEVSFLKNQNTISLFSKIIECCLLLASRWYPFFKALPANIGALLVTWRAQPQAGAHLGPVLDQHGSLSPAPSCRAPHHLTSATSWSCC